MHFNDQTRLTRTDKSKLFIEKFHPNFFMGASISRQPRKKIPGSTGDFHHPIGPTIRIRPQVRLRPAMSALP